MLSQSGIYKITCLPTGKFYIGSAACFATRWQSHRYHAKRGTHGNKYFQSSWNKHGDDNFSFEAILVCEKTDLIMYEQRVIDGFCPQMNICRTAGSTLGRKLSEEAKTSISMKNKGHSRNLGRKASEATKKKNRMLTLTQIAEKGHPRTGKTHSEATRLKMSVSKKGNTFTLGRKASDVTKAKISAAMIGHKRCVGRKLSDVTKRKIGEKNTGRKHTAEHIAKTSMACRKSIIIGKIHYDSMKVAAEAIGRDVKTLRKWVVVGSVPLGNGDISGQAVTRCELTAKKSDGKSSL